ncbi:MAG: ParB/RepB/Spo0J family partition protein, partial [Candidatus Aminicenantales bacterium]
MKKKALGKGLKAFIPEEYGILKEEKYAEIDIDRLMPNPLQPRTNFSPQSIEELSCSIRESGVLQPIIAVPEGDKYRIVIGERRWRAAQRIGLKKLPVLIRPMPRERQLESSLIENLHREDLNPIEIALAYQKLIQELNYTQEEVAQRVGKDRTSVTNSLRLLRLPKEIQDCLVKEKIAMGHARALLSLEDPEDQIILCRKIIQESLSVREVERTIQQFKRPASVQKGRASDPDLMALQEELLKALGTKVLISGTQNKG